MCHLFAHLLVCISQAGLELDSGSMGALLFPQCNVVWRTFVWAGGFRVSEFCFFLVVFFCQVWLQSLSKMFDLLSSRCLLPPSSRHLGFVLHARLLILDFPDFSTTKNKSLFFINYSSLRYAVIVAQNRLRHTPTVKPSYLNQE
jgi:hypothetical protein